MEPQRPWPRPQTVTGSRVTPSESTEPSLTVNQVSVNYGPVTALDQASLTVQRGRICAILGMNGSGKSTLFKAIMGIVPKRAGQVKIVGQDSLQARKAGLVGYVPQNEDIDHHFPISVTDVVMMGRYCHLNWLRQARTADHLAVKRALDVVGLADLANRPIGALSGGQRKRVFVARAIAQGAQVMLLDEPFAGVDYTSQAVITDLLTSLAERGTTLLVSTHDLDSVPDFADEVALLNRTVVAKGDPRDVLIPEQLVRAFTGDNHTRQAVAG